MDAIAHYEEPLRAVLSEPSSWALIATACASTALATMRRARAWFDWHSSDRAAANVNQALLHLAGRLRYAASPDEAAARLGTMLAETFDLEAVDVLLLDEEIEAFAAVGDARLVLPRRSVLAALVARTASAVDVSASGRESVKPWLPPEEQRWIDANGWKLVVPLIGTGGITFGLAAIGARKSGRDLAADVSQPVAVLISSAAPAVEAHLVRSSRDCDPVVRQALAKAIEQGAPANECRACGRVWPASSARRCGECGQAVLAGGLPWLLNGKFQLRRRLGAGGMGVVYEAVDSALGRRVAVKTLPSLSPRLCERLRREARTMARVQSRHLATIYGIEVWRQSPVLVVEFLPGGTLADRLTGGSLPVETAVAIARGVAEGLAALHAAGILHRDVKPSNIGFAVDLTTKLLDFGLAWMIADADDGVAGLEPSDETGNRTGMFDLLADEAALTVARAVAGTPLYLAPEAFAGKVRTPASDLWSLGVVLYEMLAGQHPFVEPTFAAARRRILVGRYPPLALCRPDCGPAICNLVSTLLATDPERRPTSAAEVASALRACANVQRQRMR